MKIKKPLKMFEVVDVEEACTFVTSNLEAVRDYLDAIELRGHRAIVKEVQA